MTRPPGDPAALTAGSRTMAAAAGALRDLRTRLAGAAAPLVAAGAWQGPASEAFLADGAALQTALARAADALTEAAGALAQLSGRLAHAQATWDQAHRLAASVGVDLATGSLQGGTGGGSGPQHVPPPARLRPVLHGLVPGGGAWDAHTVAVVGQATRLAAAANEDAAAARWTAAAQLEHVPAIGPPAHGPAASSSHGGAGPSPDHGRGGPHGGAGDEHGGPLRRAAGRGLEAGAAVATATHHLAAGAEARLRAAGRLAATADDPTVRAAASQVVDTAGHPLLDGRVLWALPLIAPVLDFAAAVSHGESLPRAATGAMGAAIGADLGGRAGLAACGGQAAATQGAGLVVCPALTAVGGAVGARAGRTAALHLYDSVAGRPEPSRGRP